MTPKPLFVDVSSILQRSASFMRLSLGSRTPSPKLKERRSPCPSKSVLLLPEEFLVTTLSEWLVVDELCLVDTALCSSTHRPRFLNLLGNDNGLFNNITTKAANTVSWQELISWMYHRRLHVTELSITIKLKEIERIDLLHFFNNIKSLTINHCARGSSKVIQQIAMNTSSLNTLILAHCNGIRDAEIDIFLRNNQDLKTLELSEIQTTSLASVKSIFKHCLNLESLDLNGGDWDYSASGLILDAPEYSKGCAKLKYLNLSQLPKLNEKCLCKILARCPELETLVWWDKNIPLTTETQAKLKELCPQMEIVIDYGLVYTVTSH